MAGMLFAIPNGMTFREERLINLEIFMLVVLSVAMLRVSIPVGLFALYASASLPFHQAIDQSCMLSMMAFMVLYLWVSSRKWNTEWLWNVVCAAAIINVAWQVLQLCGIYWLQGAFSAHHFMGLLSNPNETSAFLAVCLPCFFRRRWIWTIPIPLIGLWLSMSIGGIVALSMTGAIYLCFNLKRIGWKYASVLCVASALILSAYLVHRSPSLSDPNGFVRSRLSHWTEEVKVASMKPLGWGLGQWKYVMPLIETPTLLPNQARLALYASVGDKQGFERALDKVSNGNASYLISQRYTSIFVEAHNEYLEIWFALGIVGFLLCLGAIGYTLCAQGPMIAKYGFMISCLSAAWFFSFQIVPVAIVSVLYLGILHADGGDAL
jgi:hypothetical protein